MSSFNDLHIFISYTITNMLNVFYIVVLFLHFSKGSVETVLTLSFETSDLLGGRLLLSLSTGFKEKVLLF